MTRNPRWWSIIGIVGIVIPVLAIAGPKTKKKPVKKPATTEPAEHPTPATPAPTPPSTTNPGADAKPSPPAPAPATPSPSAAPSPPGPAAPTPPPSDKPAAEKPVDKPAANQPDVDTLRREYLSLRDELFKSRARASTVASQLYSTRIQIKLTYTTARFYNPAKASIRLDGATVYDNTTGAIGGDDGVRFDGYIAPGRHLVTFRVEATGKDDETFSSTTETQIVVKAVAGKDLVVAAKAKDAGDIAYEWKRTERGSYGLGIDVSVKSVARSDKAANK